MFVRSVLILALVPFACLSSASQAQTTSAIGVAEVRRLESALADDSMEGRLTGARGGTRAARYIARQMRVIGLRPVGDSGFYQRVPVSASDSGITLRSSFTDAATGKHETAFNVMGLLKGSDPTLAGEIIVVDAHYDHLGVGTPVAGDSIYNGADDDASGTVAVVAVAKALARGPHPKRSILFVLTTGEEEGLLGTTWLLAHFPRFNRQRRRQPRDRDDRAPRLTRGRSGEGVAHRLRSIDDGRDAELHAYPVVADPRPAEHFFERSDNIAFAERGIPAHTLSTFNLHADYHQPSDDVSRIDFAHMTAVINSARRAVELLANGPLPVWNEGGRPAPQSH